MFKSKYWHPAVAADIVCYVYDEVTQEPYVLLIERKNKPYKGRLALPGGFLEKEDETIEDCAIRELFEETNIDVSNVALRLACVKSKKYRDPRERVISVVYECTLPKLERPEAKDDAARVSWFSFNTLRDKKIGFDHLEVIEEATIKEMQNIRSFIKMEKMIDENGDRVKILEKRLEYYKDFFKNSYYDIQ